MRLQIYAISIAECVRTQAAEGCQPLAEKHVHTLFGLMTLSETLCKTHKDCYNGYQDTFQSSYSGCKHKSFPL